MAHHSAEEAHRAAAVEAGSAVAEEEGLTRCSNSIDQTQSLLVGLLATFSHQTRPSLRARLTVSLPRPPILFFLPLSTQHSLAFHHACHKVKALLSGLTCKSRCSITELTGQEPTRGSHDVSTPSRPSFFLSRSASPPPHGGPGAALSASRQLCFSRPLPRHLWPRGAGARLTPAPAPGRSALLRLTTD